MIDECVTYDSNIDLHTLCNNSELYIGRVFSIRIMNLDGVFSPAYYTAMLVRYDNMIGFMVLFDDSKKFYLNKFQFIELQYVTSYTLFTNTNVKWYERFMPYLNSNIVSDFITRMEIKNGDVYISINYGSNIMRITQKQVEVVIG